MTRSEIEARLGEKQKWGPTTILKFLSRLADKGFVRCEARSGRQMNLYTALISEDAYLSAESKSILGRLCSRSVKNLVAHLCENQTIGDRELEELQAFIEEKRRNGGHS